MVGHEVVVEQMAGPRIDDKAKVKQVWEGEEPLTGPLEVRISAVYLQRYNQLGIEISRGPEGGREIHPLGSVIAIYGISRQELLEIHREAQQRTQTELTEEGNPT
jgi:hypothetical protein